MKKPDYKKIYTDLLDIKKPEKKPYCMHILRKAEISSIDVINLHKIIFGNQACKNSDNNQKHKAYDQKTICEILDYQKKNHLNNRELGEHFTISRNTIAKWRKKYPI